MLRTGSSYIWCEPSVVKTHKWTTDSESRVINMFEFWVGMCRANFFSRINHVQMQ